MEKLWLSVKALWVHTDREEWSEGDLQQLEEDEMQYKENVWNMHGALGRTNWLHMYGWHMSDTVKEFHTMRDFDGHRVEAFNTKIRLMVQGAWGGGATRVKNALEGQMVMLKAQIASLRRARRFASK